MKINFKCLTAIAESLKLIGLVQKQGTPYKLKPGDIERHFCTCELLHQRQRRKDFFHRTVTGYAKWIRYDNRKCRKALCSYSHQQQSRISIDRRYLYSVCAESVVCLELSCLVKSLLRIVTDNSWWQLKHELKSKQPE